MWRATALTIFPEMFPGPLGHSLAGKALKEGVWSLEAVDIRRFATDRHGTVDDAPFGGGAGMVMKPDVLSAAIEAEVKKKDRPVWLTGHSLGGALALLAAWLLKRKFVPVEEVCTFGAPMIGNRTACDAFNREFAGRIHRWVNGRDPVPKLPTMSLVANEFTHPDRERLLGPHPMTGLVDLLGGVASKAAGFAHQVPTEPGPPSDGVRAANTKNMPT